MSHHQIVIVGGGTAGITVAARLRNVDPMLDIAIIEPSEKHYYQPLWTLVGGGMFKSEESGRDEVDLIPYGVTLGQRLCRLVRAQCQQCHDSWR